MQKCTTLQKNIVGEKKTVNVNKWVKYISPFRKHWLFSLYLQNVTKKMYDSAK